jgi:hypothetical protein
MAEVAASGRTRVRLRERVLVFLGVCLPVPVLAATGLSVPLPATVERMAAELVPFADVVPLGDAPVQTRGAIVLTQAERRRLLIVTAAAPTAVRVNAQTSPQFERRKAVLSPRRLAVREETKTKPPRTRPPAQPKPAPPPAAPPTGPVGDGPEPGDEKPKPAPPPRPQPQPRPKPDEEAKPRPKPKPKPKPDQEQAKPKEPKEPKPKPNPDPEPEAPPEPDTSPAEHEDAVEKDKGARGGKPDQTAAVSSSADGR